MIFSSSKIYNVVLILMADQRFRELNWIEFYMESAPSNHFQFHPIIRGIIIPIRKRESKVVVCQLESWSELQSVESVNLDTFSHPLTQKTSVQESVCWKRKFHLGCEFSTHFFYSLHMPHNLRLERLRVDHSTNRINFVHYYILIEVLDILIYVLCPILNVTLN